MRVLLSLPVLEYRVDNLHDQCGTQHDAIQLLLVRLRVSGAHPPRIHCHELLVKSWKQSLTVADQYRVETTLPAPETVQHHPFAASIDRP